MSQERFVGPLFKRLTQTDAGVGLAKISGPTMLREIRDFLPRPLGRARRVSVRARLVDDGLHGRRQLGEVVATLQAQGGGAKAVEVYLSDISELRTLCEEDDLLLIEPAADEPDLMRVTRVAKASPRFAATDARTGERSAGLLSGGILPRTWEHGRLRPVTDTGQVLLADFSLEGSWPRFEATFESKDGHGRNTDYEQGIAVVLERLGGLSATLLTARITSAPMLARAAQGEDVSFSPVGDLLPIGLAGRDPGMLRKALVLAGSKVGVLPEGDGNTTRRMTLTVQIPGSPLSLHELQERLAGVELAPLEDVSAEPPPPTLAPPLELLTDLEDIDAAFGHWRETLQGPSRQIRGPFRWLDSEGFGFRFDRSHRREGAVDVRIGVRHSGPPWAVEINSPRVAADANGLSTVATDQNGRRVLIRQGRLHANPDSDGDIRGEQFTSFSGLAPVEVTEETTPQKREWYVVADLEASAAQIRSSTALFVQACAVARARSLGLEIPASAPPLEAPGEIGGTYVLPAAAALPERLARRLHGDVWQALHRRLGEHGVSLVKLRHEKGYEVDGVVHTADGTILVEIKSQASAADVYEGVGQLILYSEMMKLGLCRRVLLLPFLPSSTLIEAMAACGILIETFQVTGDDAAESISFSEDLIERCFGGAIPSPAGAAS
ncbi:MAG: hypothetical protein ACI8U3_001278 [Brevundimonas sp.]|jgi:hypothetical protein|uniref:hypothetical protein n=1 Tax=Brevundimonas sp. TaxID=1871086 RepID=UPI0039E4E291